jgi:hypothetical protein
MLIWISATCLSKSLAISDWPSSIDTMHLLPRSGLLANHERVVLTRLRRWYPLHRRYRVLALGTAAH